MKKIISESSKLLVSLLLTMYIFIVPATSFAVATTDVIRIVQIDAFLDGGLIVADPATPLHDAFYQGCSDRNWCPSRAGYCKGAHIPMDTQSGLPLYNTVLSSFLNSNISANYIVVTEGCYDGLPKVIRIGLQRQW